MQTQSKTGALVVIQADVQLGVDGYGAAAIQLTGTFSGTITFEATADGNNWRTILGTPTTSATQSGTATAPGLWFFNTTGLNAIRARASAFASGRAEVTIRSTATSPASPPGSGGGGGGGTSSDFDAAFPATGTAVGFLGDDGNMAPGELAADGSLLVTVVSGGGSNASVGTTGASVPASATFVGVSDASGNLAGLATVAADMNTATPPVVPVHGFYTALPGSGGPVVGGTAANPIRINPTGTTAQPVTDAGGSLTVDGTVAATQSGTWNVATVTTVTTVSAVTAVGTVTPGTAATSLGKAEDAAHTSGDVGVMALGVANAAQSTLAADGDYIPLATDVKGNQTAVGNLADDAAEAGNPVSVSGLAKSPDGSDPGNVSAEGDRAAFTTDLNRRHYVNTNHAQSWHFHSDGSSALTDTSVQADPGVGFQTVITAVIVGSGAATAMSFFLEEGSTKVFGPYYLEAVNGRGFVSGPICHLVTAHTAVTITTSASVAQGIDIYGYIQKV